MNDPGPKNMYSKMI